LILSHITWEVAHHLRFEAVVKDGLGVRLNEVSEYDRYTPDLQSAHSPTTASDRPFHSQRGTSAPKAEPSRADLTPYSPSAANCPARSSDSSEVHDIRSPDVG